MLERKDPSQLRMNTHLTAGEAFFILQGAPQKLTKSINPTTNPEMGVDALLQFDLKFDALKTYLEGFSTVINQHASLINTIQTDVQTRLIEANLYNVIEKLGNSTVIKDKAVLSALGPLQKLLKPESTGKRQEDTVNIFCNRLDLFTHGFSHLNQVDNLIRESVTRVETQISQKVDIEEFRTKIKKTKDELVVKIETDDKCLDDKIKELETKFQTRLDNMDRKIDEVEKHTTWRIKDCEDLLRSRINDTYVDDSIRLLEERLMKEIEKTTQGNTESIQKSIKELAQKVGTMETQNEEKFFAIKKSVKELEIMLKSKLDISKFEEFKKEIQIRIDLESEKIRNVSKKCEPAIDRLNGEIITVNDEINKLKGQLKNICGDIENLQLQVTNIPPPQVIQMKESSPVRDNSGDAEKIRSEVEGQLARYRQELNKLKEKMHSLEDSLECKVEQTYLSTQLVKKLDVSEFERLISSFQSDNDKIKRLLQSNEELQSKFDKLDELIEKKLAKLRKELDIAGFLRQLKLKAEEENVFKGFENTDKKINTLSESLLAMKKEFDQALAVLEKLSLQYYSFSDSASLSTKKLNPQNCLSCGTLARNFNSPHNMMGIDGKFYKADRDAPEFYDGIHSMELKAVLGKTLIPKDRFNTTTSTLANSPLPNERVRPQTATTRAKFFKNNMTIQNPTIQVSYSQRPGSAKK